MNTGILDNLTFPYPPIDLQHHFPTIVESVDQQKARPSGRAGCSVRLPPVPRLQRGAVTAVFDVILHKPSGAVAGSIAPGCCDYAQHDRTCRVILCKPKAPAQDLQQAASMMSKIAYVYILASKKNGTLYTGVTTDLQRRVYEHKKHLAGLVSTGR